MIAWSANSICLLHNNIDIGCSIPVTFNIIQRQTWGGSINIIQKPIARQYI